MTHEQLAKTRLSDHFKVDESEIVLIDRLKGGMSNSNYVVKIKNAFFTFRIPGKNAFAFVDRHIEKDTLELIKELHLDGNLLIDLELETGYKISHYVEGTPLMVLDPSAYYDRAANVLKRLHQSNLLAKNDYAPFNRLKKYETLVENEGIRHQPNYQDILNRFLKYRSLLEAQPKTLCHNDSQPSNFILRPDGTLLLVDWEFGGNNDPYYDIACFGNNDFKFAVGLLPIYLGKTPTASDWERLYLWRVFQCLQWHNVALYKEAIGLSQEMHLDFKAIAETYIVKANALFETALTYR
jgi:thiamine kinase-like enzyme